MYNIVLRSKPMVVPGEVAVNILLQDISSLENQIPKSKFYKRGDVTKAQFLFFFSIN